MTRFQKKTAGFPLAELLLSLGVFFLILAIFFTGVNKFSAGSVERQKALLSSTLHRLITFCYANEGSYPESLAYLKENYKLTYNDQLFFVDYTVQGANLYPDVTILVRQPLPQDAASQ